MSNPDEDEDESGPWEEVKRTSEVITAREGGDVSSKGGYAECENTTEQIWQSNSWFKQIFKAVKIN